MNLDFECTGCGNCCKHLRLPLSVDEAVRWLRDGHSVQVLCEAIPWPEGLPSPNPYATFKRERSFGALSGTLPIRVLATLVAPLGARCPYLLADERCGNYAQRPLICRIYPAEVIPFIELLPERKNCPPEAWQAGGRPLLRDGHCADEELQRLIGTRLRQTIEGVASHEALCARLGIDVAAMAGEGYAAHAVDGAALLEALLDDAVAPSSPLQDWTFISQRAETVQAIRACDARCVLAAEHPSDTIEYL